MVKNDVLKTDPFDMEKYEAEAKERFGGTDAYKEHIAKTANYTKDKWQEVNDGLNAVFAKFALCCKSGCAASSNEAQLLVTELQSYITNNFYRCTNQILMGLGKMYVADARFKDNIDNCGEGTAEFISKSIEIYCN